MNEALKKRNTLILLASGVLGIAWLNLAGKHADVPEVDLPQAKALIDAGALVIDVRNKDAFDFRHVPGAMLFPLAVLQMATPAVIAAAKERQIVVYCNDGHRTGPEATRTLRDNGFRNAVNMKAGIEGWAGAGFPLVKAG